MQAICIQVQKHTVHQVQNVLGLMEAHSVPGLIQAAGSQVKVHGVLCIQKERAQAHSVQIHKNKHTMYKYINKSTQIQAHSVLGLMQAVKKAMPDRAVLSVNQAATIQQASRPAWHSPPINSHRGALTNQLQLNMFEL